MSIVGPRPVMSISFEAYPKELKKVIYNVKPASTGIGSIIFRDEEELITEVKNNGGDLWAFYKEKIYPFKGESEMWYQKHKSFNLDIKLIFLTAWVIFFIIQSFMKNGLKIYQSEIFNNNLKRKVKDYEL